ncbi:hypothetical protein BdWA1_000394 [Babesia duncani]|uniref:Uncharacterized protein n=1 Tax=Babesia duncani TaxID=323732 RepID=A0AAD9UPZ3_9APIC|nr:hypothetical protein BdWA1_000394 [Babesia duncani]
MFVFKRNLPNDRAKFLNVLEKIDGPLAIRRCIRFIFLVILPPETRASGSLFLDGSCIVPESSASDDIKFPESESVWLSFSCKCSLDSIDSVVAIFAAYRLMCRVFTFKTLWIACIQMNKK